MLLNCNYRSKRISFLDTYNKKNNVFSVLVGVNGVGKSRLLSAIAINSASIEKIPSSTKNERLSEILKNLDATYEKNFSVVIASSVSPFDKFPVVKKHSNNNNYRYLGIRGISGENIGLAHISRVASELVAELYRDKYKISAALKILNYLGYSEKINLELKFAPLAISLVSYPLLDILKHLYLNDPVQLDKMLENDDLIYISNSLNSKIRNLEKSKEYIPNEAADLKLIYNLSIKLSDLIIHGFSTLSQLLAFEKFISSNPNVSCEISDAGLRFDLPGKADAKYLSSNISWFIASGLLVLKRFGVRKINSRRLINISSASSGEQSVLISLLGISTYIKKNSLILIDEPEICLHPSWQERYISLLIDCFSSYSGCHFILATHSPQIISNLHNENCYVIDLGEGETSQSSEFTKKSADFQLAKVFHAPGYRNEYLSKQLALALSDLSLNSKIDENKLQEYSEILELKKHFRDDDPVKQLVLILEKALKAYSKEHSVD